jgi:hypothetical protein
MSNDRTLQPAAQAGRPRLGALALLLGAWLAISVPQAHAQATPWPKAQPIWNSSITSLSLSAPSAITSMSLSSAMVTMERNMRDREPLVVTCTKERSILIVSKTKRWR